MSSKAPVDMTKAHVINNMKFHYFLNLVLLVFCLGYIIFSLLTREDTRWYVMFVPAFIFSVNSLLYRANIKRLEKDFGM